MPISPFAPTFQDLPETLPIFPLRGALLLPYGKLPLNIFENRYLKMVDDALARNRLIGMIQPREIAPNDLYGIGCVGRISAFEETSDGRYLISLDGLCRFRVSKEMQSITPYRMITADWTNFAEDYALEDDMLRNAGLTKSRQEDMLNKLQEFFHMLGSPADWLHTIETPFVRLISTCIQLCPFKPTEKQAILEAQSFMDRIETLATLLDMALQSGGIGGSDDSGQSEKSGNGNTPEGSGSGKLN